MCRRTTKSFGFMLLLWIGAFLPISEYRVSHPADLGGLLSTTLAGEPADHDEIAEADTDDPAYRFNASSADLLDFTLTIGPAELGVPIPYVIERFGARPLTSRNMPPRHRPPINAAA
ncbi:hypothetical protein [Hyphomicrobium sp. 1Nfss2.1]|uniref:hypothetical protein n=1 Tax=Hyphomicrobium sp. 1Nfss2.1 TaxID=3413936 RepID=UPI003C7AA02D